MPTDKPITLQEHAMRFGTFMGIFWIFKFIFLPLGFTIPLLQLLFVLLTLFVPVLGYIYVRKFRNTYCNGEISFFRVFFIYLVHVSVCRIAGSSSTLCLFPLYRSGISGRLIPATAGKHQSKCPGRNGIFHRPAYSGF